jgi:hypothetical protein
VRSLIIVAKNFTAVVHLIEGHADKVGLLRDLQEEMVVSIFKMFELLTFLC